MSQSWLVLAMVCSVTRTPLSRAANRSGSMASASARASAGVPCMASSWQAVVIGRNWVPVTA